MSHAAVKDSCHPVSGSNTHTVNEKRALSRRDAEISGNPLLKSPNKDDEEKKITPQKGGKKRVWMNTDLRIFGYTLGISGEKKKNTASTRETVFFCA